ncbi:hypothetical protein PITC_009030 [Penicillium italicum]|uniref:Retrotransposon gag domain-containing protein n=1 Tax=Penicillium italicum TaxID=40296 RepID=A0A0A2L4A2_PENIT|nr:hypothetical protein PITC_009030 [Penicillium italicum]
MGSQIRAFYGFEDGYEDPMEFLEEWSLRSSSRPHGGGEKIFVELQRGLRMKLRQNVVDEADQWLRRLDRDVRQSWPQMRKAFLTRYAIPEDDPSAEAAQMEHAYLPLHQYKDEEVYVVYALKDQQRKNMIAFNMKQQGITDFLSARRLIIDAYSGPDSPFIQAQVQTQTQKTSQKKPEEDLTYDDAFKQSLPTVLKGLHSL